MIIKEITASVFLGICSATDIYGRKIYLNVCLCFMAAGILANWTAGQNLLWGFVISALPGVAVMLISLASGGSVGMGDGVIIITAGVIYGIRNVLNICIISFLVLSVYCLLMLLAGRRKLKDKIPFSPFLMAGNIIFIIYGVLV